MSVKIIAVLQPAHNGTWSATPAACTPGIAPTASMMRFCMAAAPASW